MVGSVTWSVVADTREREREETLSDLEQTQYNSLSSVSPQPGPEFRQYVLWHHSQTQGGGMSPNISCLHSEKMLSTSHRDDVMSLQFFPEIDTHTDAGQVGDTSQCSDNVR